MFNRAIPAQRLNSKWKQDTMTPRKLWVNLTLGNSQQQTYDNHRNKISTSNFFIV
jgi:hypothetical protein